MPWQWSADQRWRVRTGEPTLIINPRDDETFVAFARQEFREGRSSVAEFEARLRTQYPHARVRERDLSGESRTTWYVYREGRWVTSET